MIPVFRPSIGEEEIVAVNDVLRSGWIGQGPKVADFENNFASYIGAKYAVALNSCTSALHLALTTFGISKGDEVLLPTLTFVSTAHAVEYTQAKPVFCDIDPDTFCISVEDMKNKLTPNSKALIPVHYGGHPCEMDELLKVSKEYNLVIIDDAAHACGAEYKGRKIGSIGDATCFSFHAVKNIATGDGGMITTDDEEIAGQLEKNRWLGIDKTTWKRTKGHGYDWYYEVSVLGYKYHMNDIAAAIGLEQLKKLDSMNARRREIVTRYNETFRNIPWITPPIEKPYVKSALHNYVIKTHYRDELHQYLKTKRIATSVHYMPIHLHPYYTEKYRPNLPVAEQIWHELLTLPLYPDLTDTEISYIVDSVKSFR